MSVPTDSTQESYASIVPQRHIPRRRTPLFTSLMIIVSALTLLGLLTLGFAHIWVPVVLRLGR